MSDAARLFLAAVAFAAMAGGASVSLAGDPSATGQIVNAAGQPAAGVPLKVIGPIGEATVFTDGNGIWTLYELPAGNYQIIPFGDPSAQTAAFTIAGNAGPQIVAPLRIR